jgi:hypothetical protein
MSEEIPETADGAIRAWIVAVGFTLVLVGGELMAEKDGIRFWTGFSLAIASLPCYLSAVWWKTLRAHLDDRFLTTLKGVATDARWWTGALFIVMAGLLFTGPVISELSRWLRPNPAQLVAPPPTPPKLPQPALQPHAAEAQLSVRVVPQAPSPLLRLTDDTRWRFVTSFWEAVSANGTRPHCSATVSVKMEQPDVNSIGRAERLWDELQPLLSYSNWQISGGGLGGTSYRGGITILVGAGGGDPLICGAQLAEELQSRTPIQVSIRKNQVTPKLEECKYECVEIQVGNAVMR